MAALVAPRLSRRPSAPPAKIPSPLQAAIMWLFTMALVVAGSMAVWLAAGLIAVSTGLSPERAIEVLSDPKRSPLVTSPTWISIAVLVSEAVLALSLWRFLRRHRLFLHEVCPLGVPTLRDVVGALGCVFGLAPLAGLLAELMRRQLPRDVNARSEERRVGKECS